MQDNKQNNEQVAAHTTASELDQLKKLRHRRILIGLILVGAVVLLFAAIAAISNMGSMHGSRHSDSNSTSSNSTLSSVTGVPIAEFFKSDSAVDAVYVKDFFDNLPSHPPGFEEQAFNRLSSLIDGDAAKGAITTTQAAALKEAFKKELGL